jgi:hypothetical protein
MLLTQALNSVVQSLRLHSRRARACTLSGKVQNFVHIPLNSLAENNNLDTKGTWYACPTGLQLLRC